MFEGELMWDYLWYLLYKCPDWYRAVRGKVVLFWITIEWLKMRITEMHEKIQWYWSKYDRRRYKWVYLK